MKTSTEHLPPCCREELRVLRSLTVRHIPDCCLIILGGNHAGQDYVSWSESVVRGRHTLYRHDYEIAVFVEGTETKKASRTLRRRIAELTTDFSDSDGTRRPDSSSSPSAR